MFLKKSAFGFKDFHFIGIFGIFAGRGTGNFDHFLFGKFIVAGEFRKNLEVVSVFVEEIGGNTVGFSVFNLIGIKRKIVSGTGFAFRVNSVAVVGVERNFAAF